ncbi:MAG: hypothetical protein N2512_05055 [Armatimonadetes bacterium]|nr:hypothetical protein [Armatimonadota bacterium]
MRCVALVGVLSLMLTGAWAKDIVSMPESTMMKPSEVELAYIYWDTDIPEHANVGELFIGLTDRIELDVIHVDLSCPVNDSVTEANLYVKLLDEVPGKQPTLVVGATNITGADWLPSEEAGPPDGDRRISPFLVAGYTIRPPKLGPPSWNDPAVRLQLGVGANYHEDKPFGILQIAFTPHIVAAIQNYQGSPGYLVGFESGKGWGIHVGTLGDNPWVHVYGDFKLNF